MVWLIIFMYCFCGFISVCIWYFINSAWVDSHKDWDEDVYAAMIGCFLIWPGFLLVFIFLNGGRWLLPRFLDFLRSVRIGFEEAKKNRND